MKAYLFWYKSDEYAPIEYIYIIAVSVKQARYFFIKNGYMNMYDASLKPVDYIDKLDFLKPHKIGDILGQYAVI